MCAKITEVGLRVFGFLLSQKAGIEVFDAGRFESFQAPLTRITALSGIKFADSLHQADTLHGEPG
jgi:hypothetical protein